MVLQFRELGVRELGASVHKRIHFVSFFTLVRPRQWILAQRDWTLLQKKLPSLAAMWEAHCHWELVANV